MPRSPFPDDERLVAQIEIHVKTGGLSSDSELVAYARSAEFASEVNLIVRNELGPHARVEITTRSGSAIIYLAIFALYAAILNIGTFISSLQAIVEAVHELINQFSKYDIRNMVTTITPVPWREGIEARERRPFDVSRGWMTQLIPLAILFLMVMDAALLIYLLVR